MSSEKPVRVIILGQLLFQHATMDNFGDNFDDGDVDPAAEFLAREQTQLAGLEDDLNTTNVPIGVTQTLSNGNR